jgi:hypothetical protein
LAGGIPMVLGIVAAVILIGFNIYVLVKPEKF